jgi:hypothetical protein
MGQSKEFASALTVRLGMAAGGVLGGFAGYGIRAVSTPGQEGVLTWPTAAGAVAGFTVSWAALVWLARRHRGGGVIVGAVLIIAAAVTLLARVIWQRGG